MGLEGMQAGDGNAAGKNYAGISLGINNCSGEGFPVGLDTGGDDEVIKSGCFSSIGSGDESADGAVAVDGVSSFTFDGCDRSCSGRGRDIWLVEFARAY